MHPSFQSSTYTHAFQTQTHGPSNLKIFAGEDLSTPLNTQPAATGSASNSCSPKCGGSSSRNSANVARRCSSSRRRPSTSRLCKSTSTADSSKKRRPNDSEIWNSPTNRQTLSSWKKKSTKKPSTDNWKHTRNWATYNTSQAMTSLQKTQ